METSNIRHIIAVHRHKIVGLLLVSFLALLPIKQASAQLNYLEYINKKIYFGITLGYYTTNFKIVHDKSFIYNDTIQRVISNRGPGFTLGIVSNLKLGRYFDLRMVPTLTFGDRSLRYQLPHDSIVDKSIESIQLDFPLMVRFKSQPIRDMRFYVLFGMKYSIDLAANAQARKAEDQVKIYRNDVSYEYGLGIQIFFPLFIFSPEVKFSNGILNLHARDENLIYSSVIDKLLSRTIIFSIHFEG